jgi:hypothetical protein
MTSKEIEKYDPDKIMEGVRARIKATFVELIPDAHWEKMIQGEIDEFFTKKEQRHTYRTVHSDFGAVVKEELTNYARGKMKSFLLEYETHVSTVGKVVVNEEIRNMIIDRTPEIFTNLISGAINAAINNLRHTDQISGHSQF